MLKVHFSPNLISVPNPTNEEILREVVDMAVAVEEAIFKEQLRLKILSTTTSVVRAAMLRRIVGIKTNQSATTNGIDLSILRKIANLRVHSKHNFLKRCKVKGTYSMFVIVPLKLRMMCGIFTVVVATT